MLEALPNEIRCGCPKLLYADDCVSVSGSLEGLKGKLEGKRALESRGLTVNINKTKITYSNENATKVREGNLLFNICYFCDTTVAIGGGSQC